ncbi:MAG: formate--tetrahydrofolate ligase [Arhodomonas sp.]|nr:formate--tetrahydrofolate ligase [Arhodomonas sp.]
MPSRPPITYWRPWWIITSIRVDGVDLDPDSVRWQRVVDINDRALRNTVIGLGPRADGVTRQTGFEITAASEVMAVLALADSVVDLRRRLGRMVVGYTR